MEKNKILYPEVEDTLKKSKYNLSEKDKIFILNKIIKNLPEKKSVRLVSFPAMSLAFSTLAIVLFVLLWLVFNTFRLSPETVEVVSGSINISKHKITAGNTFKTGDFIITEKDGCELRLKKDSLIKLFDNSEIRVNSTRDKNLIVELRRGLAFFDIKKQTNTHFVVKTPNVEIFIKGTVFSVEVKSKEETVITLLDGKLEIKSKQKREITKLNMNEVAYYKKGMIDKRESFLDEEAKELKKWRDSIYQQNIFQTAETSKMQEGKIETEISESAHLYMINRNFVSFNKNKLMIYSRDGKLVSERKIISGNDVNTLSVLDNNIYLTTESGGLLAYGANGNLLWENKEAGVVKFLSIPVKYENLIFLATIDRGIQVFDAKSGSFLDTINPEKKEAIYNSPLIISKNSLIYFTESGNLIHYDFVNKKEIWKINLGDRIIPPFIHNERSVFVISKVQKKLLAINIEDGRVLWEKPASLILYREPIKIYKEYLVLVGEKEFFVFNSNDGSLLNYLKLTQNVKNILMKGNKIYLLFEDSLVRGYKLPEFNKFYEEKFDDKIENFLINDNYLLLIGKNVMRKVILPY